MNDKIAKPVTLMKEEFTNELVNIINSSALPMFLIEYILKDILSEVHIASAKQLQEDEKKYSQQLAEQTDPS